MSKLAGGRIKQRRDRERAVLDTYHTPFCATRELLRRVAFSGRILEPACGAGYIAYALEAAGHSVAAGDIRRVGVMEGALCGMDFFDRAGEIPNIVTNPPFCIAEEFIRHGFSMFTEKMALLLRLSFVASEGRYELFRTYPPSRIIILSKRLPYQDPSGRWNITGGQFDHAWFVWDRESMHRGTNMEWALPDVRLIYPPNFPQMEGMAHV